MAMTTATQSCAVSSLYDHVTSFLSYSVPSSPTNNLPRVPLLVLMAAPWKGGCIIRGIKKGGGWGHGPIRRALLPFMVDVLFGLFDRVGTIFAALELR